MSAAETATRNAVEPGTSSKQTLAWERYETVDSIITELIASNQSHVEPPLIAWHRPSAWQINPTQDLMKMENLHFFYNNSSEVIRS